MIDLDFFLLLRHQFVFLCESRYFLVSILILELLIMSSSLDEEKPDLVFAACFLVKQRVRLDVKLYFRKS